MISGLLVWVLWGSSIPLWHPPLQFFKAAQLCDRVAIIYQGELKALDSPEYLRHFHTI